MLHRRNTLKLNTFLIIYRVLRGKKSCKLKNEVGRESDEAVLRDEIVQRKRRKSQFDSLQLGRLELDNVVGRRSDRHLRLRKWSSEEDGQQPGDYNQDIIVT